MKRRIILTFILVPVFLIIICGVLADPHFRPSSAEEESGENPEVTAEPTLTPSPEPTPFIPVEEISVKYTVKSNNPDSVVKDKTELKDGDAFELWIGDKIPLTVKASPEEASDKTIVYESSNPTVATISAKGTVTVKNMGDTTITISPFTNPEIKVSFSIHVYKKSINVVTDMGAIPDDGQSDLSPIKKALAQAQYLKSGDTMSITIPEGTYDIDGTIGAYSNTKLTLDKNTVMKRAVSSSGHSMLKSHTYNTVKGYDQITKFTMSGGTWDGQADGSASANVLYFGHGKSITIKNTTVKNTSGGHLIEFAGIKKGTIKNVTLKGFVLPKTGDSYTSLKEAIQLDYCSSASTPAMKPHDLTACKDIEITGCDISDYMCGIGAHGATPGVYLKDISITDNKFNKISNVCIDSRNFKDITVKNNKVTGFNEFFYSENSTGTIKENTVKNKSFTKLTKFLLNTANGIELIKSEFTVDANSLTGQKANGIYIGTDSKAKIKNNTINKSKKYGIYSYKAKVYFEKNTFSENKKGDYHTTKEAKVKTSDDIRAYHIELKEQYPYTGKKIKPIKKIKNLNKKYYTIKYKNNKKRGTATITIKGKGKVKKKQKLKFKIV